MLGKMLKLIALGVCLLSILPFLDAAKAIKGKQIDATCMFRFPVTCT